MTAITTTIIDDINAHHEAAQAAARSAVEHALAAGRTDWRRLRRENDRRHRRCFDLLLVLAADTAAHLRLHCHTLRHHNNRRG